MRANTCNERNYFYCDPALVLRAVPLSDTTVKRRINEMGANIEDQLCEILRSTFFTLQLDKTTTSDNNALLIAYSRYIAKDGNIMEKLLFCKCLSDYLQTNINSFAPRK